MNIQDNFHFCRGYREYEKLFSFLIHVVEEYLISPSLSPLFVIPNSNGEALIQSNHCDRTEYICGPPCARLITIKGKYNPIKSENPFSCTTVKFKTEAANLVDLSIPTPCFCVILQPFLHLSPVSEYILSDSIQPNSSEKLYRLNLETTTNWVIFFYFLFGQKATHFELYLI